GPQGQVSRHPFRRRQRPEEDPLSGHEAGWKHFLGKCSNFLTGTEGGPVSSRHRAQRQEITGEPLGPASVAPSGLFRGSVLSIQGLTPLAIDDRPFGAECRDEALAWVSGWNRAGRTIA